MLGIIGGLFLGSQIMMLLWDNFLSAGLGAALGAFAGRHLSHIYYTRLKPKNANQIFDETSYEWWIWFAATLSLCVGGTTVFSVIQAGAPGSIASFQAVKWSTISFITLCPLFLFGAYVSKRKMTPRTKKILTIFVWVLAVALFLLPFIMVGVFGKE